MTVARYYGPKVSPYGDPIDCLMGFTGGDILRMPDGGAGGEYDAYDLTRGELRRLVGGRLVSRVHGLSADVLAAHALERGCRHAESVDGFVAWYLEQGLRGLDVRRDGSPCADGAGDPDRVAEWEAWQALESEGVTDDEYRDSLVQLLRVADGAPRKVGRVAERRAPQGGWPGWVTEWHGSLVHPPKAEWFRAYAAFRLEGGVCPDMSVSWADKVRRQWDNREAFHGR